MAKEGAGVKVSLGIKGDKTEGDPDDADRLAVHKFYADVGHPHPRSGEAGQAVALRIQEHLPELLVRQAIQSVGLVEQKHPKREAHQLLA